MRVEADSIEHRWRQMKLSPMTDQRPILSVGKSFLPSAARTVGVGHGQAEARRASHERCSVHHRHDGLLSVFQPEALTARGLVTQAPHAEVVATRVPARGAGAFAAEERAKRRDAANGHSCRTQAAMQQQLRLAEAPENLRQERAIGYASQ
eukprot:6753073-Prymnesium_polylepis.1